MPANILVKAAFVRGELDNIGRDNIRRKDAVRTDFILQNIYSYLLGDRYSYSAVSAMNKKEEDVFRNVKDTVDAFRLTYASTVKSLCSEIGAIEEDTIGSVLLGVSNELFSEGITWGRITAFFVFIGELTIMCLSRNLPKRIVNVMYDRFSSLVREKLEPWVYDHGGWEGITSLSSVTQQENSTKMSNSGWAKSLLYGTVRMFGTLAHIANSANHVVP